MAPQYGLIPGSAYDIELNDEDGQPWDFDIPKQRSKCVKEIASQGQAFSIGSPMCTAFSILQGLNKNRTNADKWEAMWKKGVRHMPFAIKLYRIRVAAGR